MRRHDSSLKIHKCRWGSDVPSTTLVLIRQAALGLALVADLAAD